MSYKIVVDSCCELPEEYLQDPRFEIVPLGLEVGDYQIQDDENFDQAEFLKKVAECPKCPKSACPSPERFREAYHTEAEHVYVITLSSHLSGSYNSAVLGMNLYREKYGKKQIHVIDAQERQTYRCESTGGIHTEHQADHGRRQGQYRAERPERRHEESTPKNGGDRSGRGRGYEGTVPDDHPLQCSWPRRDHEEASYGKGRVQRMPDHGHPRCQQHVRQRWRRDRDGVKRLIS